MSLPNDLPVPSTSRVLRPRAQSSRHSHGPSRSGNGPAGAKPNMATNSNNPSPTPGFSGLIGPGRSAERPLNNSTSTSRTMDGEDATRWWGSTYPYPGSYGDGYANDELSYPPGVSYGNFNDYQNTSDPYGRSLGWEDPFRGGFAGPSAAAIGSGESSLAGALGAGGGERKKRKREDGPSESNLYPTPGPSSSYAHPDEGSSTGFAMGGSSWAPHYAGPSNLGSVYDYREPSGSLDTRYFDDPFLPTQPNDMTESDRKGKGKAREQPITENEPFTPVAEPNPTPPKQSAAPTTSCSSKAAPSSTSTTTTTKPTKPPADPLSDYTCPICFSAPTNATITPCGHICCGSCLFAAVKAGIQRAGMEHHPGGNRGREGAQARCPVCRSVIPGWDGKGGGVIGLKAV